MKIAAVYTSALTTITGLILWARDTNGFKDAPVIEAIAKKQMNFVPWSLFPLSECIFITSEKTAKNQAILNRSFKAINNGVYKQPTVAAMHPMARVPYTWLRWLFTFGEISEKSNNLLTDSILTRIFLLYFQIFIYFTP